MRKLLLLIIIFTFSSCAIWTCDTCLQTQHTSSRYYPNLIDGQCLIVDSSDYLFKDGLCKDCCRKKIEKWEKMQETFRKHSTIPSLPAETTVDEVVEDVGCLVEGGTCLSDHSCCAARNDD